MVWSLFALFVIIAASRFLTWRQARIQWDPLTARIACTIWASMSWIELSLARWGWRGRSLKPGWTRSSKFLALISVLLHLELQMTRSTKCQELQLPWEALTHWSLKSWAEKAMLSKSSQMKQSFSGASTMQSATISSSCTRITRKDFPNVSRQRHDSIDLRVVTYIPHWSTCWTTTVMPCWFIAGVTCHCLL